MKLTNYVVNFQGLSKLQKQAIFIATRMDAVLSLVSLFNSDFSRIAWQAGKVLQKNIKTVNYKA